MVIKANETIKFVCVSFNKPQAAKFFTCVLFFILVINIDFIRVFYEQVPCFGILFDEAIVESNILARIVRATAICASRAKRTTLSYYQQQ